MTTVIIHLGSCPLHRSIWMNNGHNEMNAKGIFERDPNCRWKKEMCILKSYIIHEFPSLLELDK